MNSRPQQVWTTAPGAVAKVEDLDSAKSLTALIDDHAANYSHCCSSLTTNDSDSIEATRSDSKATATRWKTAGEFSPVCISMSYHSWDSRWESQHFDRTDVRASHSPRTSTDNDQSFRTVAHLHYTCPRMRACRDQRRQLAPAARTVAGAAAGPPQITRGCSGRVSLRHALTHKPTHARDGAISCARNGSILLGRRPVLCSAQLAQSGRHYSQQASKGRAQEGGGGGRTKLEDA
jgi:hypothetical protein